MTITSRFYPSAVAKMFNNDINNGDTFKCALLDSDGIFVASDSLYSDVVGDEIPATGNYSAGGATITPTVTAAVDAAYTKTEFTLGSASWLSATLTFQNAVIYSSTSGALLMHLSWISQQESVGQDYTINPPSPKPSATPTI